MNSIKTSRRIGVSPGILLIPLILAIFGLVFESGCSSSKQLPLKQGFTSPPPEYRPGVYWYFMDGNLSQEAMTRELEAMKEAGIGWALFLEVNVGVPRGQVDFLSQKWQELFAHAIKEGERLGIKIIMGSGPGWAGSGGPWVKPEESMQHLVSSEVRVKGPGKFDLKLPVPRPKTPFFGENTLTPELKQAREDWYQDVAVLAFPTPEMDRRIPLIEEKALYYRAPFTSQPGVWPHLPPPAEASGPAGSAIKKEEIIDLTSRLKPNGSLDWEIPPGSWTVRRFVARNNGAVTRPAPLPGLGFECDKFSREAFESHLHHYLGPLLERIQPNGSKPGGGWKMIHIDSWEMGAQNWSQNFRQEFIKRRGYDPLPYYPVYAGCQVGTLEESERFLWDLRKTSSELIVENHALEFKEFGRKYGFKLSIEPYDMNPASDFDLGAVADVPMSEFWSDGFGYNSSFSVIEATSIAHITGAPVVAAEAFTAGAEEAWKKYPGNMKNQTDWAFCLGLNRLIFHTFAHSSLDEKLKPGMTMGPYGVHWDNRQTWWPMVRAYHEYIARCQFLLAQGKPVADVLYLIPEGAPQVFRSAPDAMDGTEFLPDKRGFSFDGCSPEALMKLAEVEKGQIVFPGGASYKLLVLPAFETMTPELLRKIEELIREGATVIGNPPRRSPSLKNFPDCDLEVEGLAKNMWGGLEKPQLAEERIYGKGKIFWGGGLNPEVVKSDSDPLQARLYPDYQTTAGILEKIGLSPDFSCSSGKIRYTHRSLTETEEEIYFISNRSGESVDDVCTFRDGSLRAELWDPLSGERRPLDGTQVVAPAGVRLEIRLEPEQSFFIVFKKDSSVAGPHNLSTGISSAPGNAMKDGTTAKKKTAAKNQSLDQIAGSGQFVFKNFPQRQAILTLGGPWKVKFDPAWGGPGEVVFEQLLNWAIHPDDGIRYYSGTAVYTAEFDLPEGVEISRKDALYVYLGEVFCLARVKLNGQEEGIVWTKPARVRLSGIKKRGNCLEVEVANLWINRLIGDENEPWDGVVNGSWPEWLLIGSPRPTKRLTFTTHHFYRQGDPLVLSGLLGPVRLLK